MEYRYLKKKKSQSSFSVSWAEKFRTYTIEDHCEITNDKILQVTIQLLKCKNMAGLFTVFQNTVPHVNILQITTSH